MSKSLHDSRRSTPADSSSKEGSVDSVSTLPRFRLIQPRIPSHQAVPTTLQFRPAPPAPRRPGACGIPKCLRSPCTLNTHRQYARTTRQTHQAILTSRFKRPSPLSSGAVSSEQSTLAASLSRTSSPELQLGTYPDLSFKKPYPIEFRHTFDFLVNHFFDKLTLVFRPPMKAGFKQQQIQEILSSELLTAASLLQTRNHLKQHSSDRSADAVSTSLYSMVARIMHRQLNELSHTNADDLIFCVIALLNFDLLQNKPETLATHKRGIEHLVSSRGGVHNLGKTLPFIVQTDRRLAILTGTYPTFSSPAPGSLTMQQRSTAKYGSAFVTREVSQTLHRVVLMFCRNECGLIAFFEKSKICFDMDSPSQGDPNSLPYFFFSRDQLSAEFANLYVQYRPIHCKERYVLIATRIVEYPIVYGGLTIMLVEFLADQLTGLLKEELRDGIPADWTDYQDMLSWILWVLVTTQIDWKGKDWVRELLKHRLGQRYATVHEKKATGKTGKGQMPKKKGIWQQGWRGKEWEQNIRWMWSEEHLRKRFDAFCDWVEAE